MADLGVPEETTEYRDPPDVLQNKIKQLANLIRQVATAPHFYVPFKGYMM